MPSLTQSTTELFAVARDGVPINDEGHGDVVGARGALKTAEDGMRAAGLEPDLHLVTIERSITFRKPKVFVDPEAVEPDVDEEPEPEEPPVPVQ